ncbi:hypothetical protein [Enterobacter sp. Cy-643]|uniref:winged helix-turn-helix domain-containing protein n=1 Tax=Enterobacter sp. Cy-643 TaxID=2608346 RepID=UPI00141EF667|nr:hypothetical protein [Enterobacter sp. Cy-643]
MKKWIFLINEKVVFSPCDRTLSRVDGSIPPIVLNTPSAIILEVLLTSKETTPQKKLYESAWRDNGAKTTPNNLYQNISLLRRGLNEIFAEVDEYILTVPRKGFHINPTLTVNAVESDDDPAYGIDVPAIPHKQKIPNEINIKNAERNTNVLSKVIKSIRDKILIFRPLLLLAIACSLVIALLIWAIHQYQPLNFFSNYILFDKNDRCHIYFHPDATKDLKEMVITHINPTCATHSHQYVTTQNGFPTVSVIACKKAMSSNAADNNCDSWFYQGLLKNEN